MGILGSFVSWGTQDSFIHVGGRLFFGITLYYFAFFILFPWEKTVSIIHGIFYYFFGNRLALFMVYLVIVGQH